MSCNHIDDIWEDWKSTVNMTARELEKWLASEKSEAVGERRFGAAATGHESGRRIVQILRKPKQELTQDDVVHMSSVVGFVQKHLAQRPRGDVRETRWRYSLMNWGHDPLKT